jgi:tetratricopeptide (TPR) repeat protein
MKIKKKKEKPILKRARKPAEAAAETRFQRVIRPVAKRWKLIVAIAGGAVVLAAAVGGFFWYRHDREVRAARAYAHVQERLTEEVKKAGVAAGKEGRVDEEALATKTVAELENVVERFGDTATGRAAAYELASLYFGRGEYENARKLFADVEAKSSGLEETLAAMGVADCDRALGEYDAAISKYRLVFEKNRGEFPGVPAAMNLAGCYRQTGKLGEAAKMYRYVLDYHRLSPYAGEADRELRRVEAVMEAEKKSP